MASEIIIVGNGTSVLDRKLGDKIDQYTDVVRFNGFDIKGFESHIGSKSTIWFNVMCFNRVLNWRFSHNWKAVYLHSWQWDKTIDDLYINFNKVYEANNLPKPAIYKTSKSTVLEISEFAKDQRYTTFSTGLFAIWEMIKLYGAVDITGFDWWDREAHHYNDTAIRGDLHIPKKEKAIIDALAADGKVFII